MHINDQKTSKTIKLFRVGVTPWLVEGRFLGPTSICIIICVSTQHAYHCIRQGVKNSKLADVSTGLAVLDVDTRWTRRGAGGSLPLSPVCCSLGLCNCKCNKVKNWNVKTLVQWHSCFIKEEGNWECKMTDKSKSLTCHEHKLCLTDELDLKHRTRFKGQSHLSTRFCKFHRWNLSGHKYYLGLKTEAASINISSSTTML